MRTPIPAALTAILCICTPPAPAESVGSSVSVELLAEGGRPLPLYPAPNHSGAARVYAEAQMNQGYAIRVRNNTGRRVGLVIAVDGRNILSGAQSWLGPRERMYVLEPYGCQEYAGWRSSQDRIHRFYFTNPSDSYAGAFGDESAMGLVAVAVYVETRPLSRSRIAIPDRFGTPMPSCPPAPEGAPRESRKAEAPGLDLESRAGTGYGAEDFSPSVTVSFTPESAPREKVLIKYEWRETLLRLGVIPRHQPHSPRNRLWDEGYAPPPPRW